MKMFNKLVLAGAASAALSSCAAIKDAIDSIPDTPQPNGAYRSVVVPDLAGDGFSNVELRIYGKNHVRGESVDIGTLIQNTVTNEPYRLLADREEKGVKSRFKEEGVARIYKNHYSAVLAAHAEKQTHNHVVNRVDQTKVLAVQGLATRTEDMAKFKGTYLYDGVAFTGKDKEGRLSYSVDFDNRTGNGVVRWTGSNEELKLHAGSLTQFAPDDAFQAQWGVQGAAVQDGNPGLYRVGLFGPKADEIAGSAQVGVGGNIRHIGLGGRKIPFLKKDK
ncbi:factor H binding protein domain-containing protein [Neisseria weaveri]|uniref:factor H binding protein domain-containing protein n=1 Tax=Neisseria weaveri TaxID=28091 RepID=UPI0002230409|nr:factor H binding protein domain-containing protein [Neisseria weaveri]EGV36225.1 hypothetical protein l13_09830 [Neisseria weaveri ATCC 51223]